MEDYKQQETDDNNTSENFTRTQEMRNLGNYISGSKPTNLTAKTPINMNNSGIYSNLNNTMKSNHDHMS